VAARSPAQARSTAANKASSSVAAEAGGIPLVALPAPANHRDDGLLAATLDAIGVVGPLPERPMVHLDAGYDWQPCRQALAERGMVGEIAARGRPAPVQVGRRWVIERTHAWGNQYGKLRWCTERRRTVVGFWLGAGQRPHRPWPADQARLELLPLGRPPPPPTLTPAGAGP
jgi:hypothetical protein